jgi:hypothetical protein
MVKWVEMQQKAVHLLVLEWFPVVQELIEQDSEEHYKIIIFLRPNFPVHSLEVSRLFTGQFSRFGRRL